MAVLRVNNVGDPLGSVNPITLTTPTATTASWVTAPLNMPAVASPNILKVIAEPNTSNEEIMYVTAYTSGTATATVTRAQEGSTGRAHTSTAWAHGSTAADFALGGDVNGDIAAATVTQIQGHGVWNNTPVAQSFFLGDGNGNWGPYNLNVGSTSTVALANRGAPGTGFDLVVTDSGWQALALSSPWANFGAPYRNLSARLVGKTVHLDGLVSPSASVTGASTMATVPSTMYPTNEQLFWVQAAGTAWIRLDITTSGQINFNAYGSSTIAASTWVSLSGLTWLIG